MTGLLVLVGLAAAAAWVALLNGAAQHTFPGNADDASSMLAGHDMVTGNPLLHGWLLPGDPMFPELAVYGLLAAVVGVQPALIYATGLVLGVAAVAVAAWVASIGSRNRLLAAGVAFVLIGLPVRPMAEWLLQAPMHMSTVICCLLAFVAFGSRMQRSQWFAAAGLLAFALFTDPFAYIIGVGPVLAAAAVTALIRRSWKTLWWSASAVVAAVVAALVVRGLIPLIGGFDVTRSPVLRGPDTWPARAQLGAKALVRLLGATPNTPRVSHSPILHWVHVIGAIAVVAALAYVAVSIVRRILRGPARAATDDAAAATEEVPADADEAAGWLDRVLFFGVLASIGGYVILYDGEPSSRYVMPGVIFGGILAGRLAGRYAVRLRRSWRVGAALALLAVGILYALTPFTLANDAKSKNPAETLVAWLDQHDLHAGLAPYWHASTLTVLSHDRVRIRPVLAKQGRLAGSLYFADEDWFRPGQNDHSRFVLFPAGPAAEGVDLATATATFGPPEQVVDVAGYKVGVWKGPLVRELGPPAKDFLP